MATKTKDSKRYQSPTEQVAALIRRKDAVCMGPCLVQCPGAWLRAGPAWVVPGIGWVVGGPGAYRWGTEKGLGELAVADTAKPEWHDPGWSIAPSPNLVFAILPVALEAPYMGDVRAWTEHAAQEFGA